MRIFAPKFTDLNCSSVSTVDTDLFSVDLVGGTRRGRRVPFSHSQAKSSLNFFKVIDKDLTITDS